MVKRVHRKKDICSLEAPRFVDFKEAAKLTYDRYVSYFAATLTPYFSRVCFCFLTTILFINELLYLLSGMILFIPLSKNCFLNVCVVAVAYRRWPFTRGSNREVLTRKVLKFWIGGSLWEMVAYERWSHIQVQLYVKV